MCHVCRIYTWSLFLKRKTLGTNPIDYACNMEIIEAQECEMISPSKNSHQILDNIIKVLKQLIGCNREYDFWKNRVTRKIHVIMNSWLVVVVVVCLSSRIVFFNCP